MEICLKELVGVWMHSNEEDEGDQQVFRREEYDFPPSRGRNGISLEEGGKAADITPGPADAGQATECVWSLNERVLKMNTGQQEKSFEIVLLEPDKLILKRG